MVRYTLLRFLIFFGCLALLWLVGLRERGEALFLVVGAALLSMAISFFALKPFRQQYSAEIAEKIEHRAERKHTLVTDEDYEDAEDASPRSDVPARGSAAQVDSRHDSRNSRDEFR